LEVVSGTRPGNEIQPEKDKNRHTLTDNFRRSDRVMTEIDWRIVADLSGQARMTGRGETFQYYCEIRKSGIDSF
jgi:hypothetical protein